MFTLQKSKVGKASAEYTLLSLTLGGVVVRDMDEGGKLPAEFDNYQIVEPDDLVFCLFDIDETPRTIGIAHNHGMITGAYSVYRALPPGVPEYVFYYFLHLDSFKGLRPFYTGLRKVVRADTFSKVTMPAPPLPEQEQIAAFLDYETAKIDALIARQQQLIALLGEKRHAVISHAVTKGLNPDAPMRDSGIKWLGEVPEHWTVCRLKHVISFLTSGPRGWSDLISDDGESVFLQSGDLNDELGLRLKTAKRITPPSNAEGVRTRMRDGDVVVCVTGANTGRVAFASELSQTVFVNQHLALVRPMLEVANPCFLATLLSSTSTRNYFAVKQYGLKEGLSLTNVAETPVCIPPLNEQDAIVEHLRAIESRMKRLREIADDQVELLQERRTALISAAVTGKIDVRGWKPPSSGAKQETEMEVA